MVPFCHNYAFQARPRELHLDLLILAFIDGSAPGIKPSMQRDVEAGRPSELESMLGIVVRLGAELDAPTPVMRTAYALLKPRELAVKSPA